MKRSEVQLIKDLEGVGYITFDRVIEILGITRSSWYHGIRVRKYPQAIKFGMRSLWLKSEIEKLIGIAVLLPRHQKPKKKKRA